MKYSFVTTTFAFTCLFLLTAGCAPNSQYRTNFAAYNKTAAEAGTDPANKAVVETTTNYNLGFVEFDEEGWFRDTNQAQFVEDMIRKEANVGRADNAAGIVLIVFVHGWKNNAAYNAGNVATFRTALQQLNDAEIAQSTQDQRPARKLVGVYCGWRGLSSTWEPFKELTFWNRKTTAHRVGGYGAMTQLFVELEKIQEASNGTIRNGGPRTELIIVGHSFGAAAVYSAISGSTTERFVDNVEHDPPELLKPMGDQVILLNPAFEASRHWNLNQLATTVKQYPATQRPVLSIFTSEGDWATHYALPVGRFFSTMLEKFPDPKERRAARDAVGWFGPFVTHTLLYNTNAILGGTATNSTYDPMTRKNELHDKEKWAASSRHVREQRKKWIPNNTDPPVTYHFDDCILEPKPTFRPGDPFLVVAVDKHIMKDHDDIDNPVLINFLGEYIQFCHQETAVNGKPK